jgi:hypothetical protein
MRFYTDYDMSDPVFFINDVNTVGFHNAGVFGLFVADQYFVWSTRERKKEIEKFEDADYESALAFVDDLDLNYYKIREEASKLYTATQIGFIAEDNHPVLSGPKRDAISVSNLTVLNTGAIKAMNEKIETIEKQNQTISDFGVESAGTAYHFVTFSEDFKSRLNGAHPVVTATPAQLGVQMSISKITQEGFLVEITPPGNLGNVNFNWIAMAKVEAPAENAPAKFSDKFSDMLQSAVEQKPSDAFAPPPNPELVKEATPFVPDPKIFNNNLAVPGHPDIPTPTHNPAPVKEQPAPAADVITDKK